MSGARPDINATGVLHQRPQSRLFDWFTLVSVGDMEDTVHLELHEGLTIGERGDRVIKYQSDVLLHSPHGSTVTSPGAIDSPPWPGYTFPYLPTDVELVDPMDLPLAPPQSAPLTQDNGAVASPVSSPTYDQMPGTPQTSQDNSHITSPNINDTTFGYPMPGAPEPEPSTGTRSSSFNSTTSPATASPRNPKRWRCPHCPETLTRWQDCDRHILTHLPHWIHCPLWHCSWRGSRVKSFEQHWRRDDHLPYYESYGGIPGREHFELFDPKLLLNPIKAGTFSVSFAALQARIWVIEKSVQLQKPSLFENEWGYKLKQAPQ